MAWVGAAALVIIVVLALLLTRTSPRPPADRPPLSEEQKTYLQEIVIRNARMSAAENFLGDTVTYFDAELTNQGAKRVRELELELVFFDTLNQVVLRETVRPITPRTKSLEPQETRSLQVPFEHVPLEWNQAPPRVTPVYVGF